MFGGGWVLRVNGCSIIAGEQEGTTHPLLVSVCLFLFIPEGVPKHKCSSHDGYDKPLFTVL